MPQQALLRLDIETAGVTTGGDASGFDVAPIAADAAAAAADVAAGAADVAAGAADVAAGAADVAGADHSEERVPAPSGTATAPPVAQTDPGQKERTESAQRGGGVESGGADVTAGGMC